MFADRTLDEGNQVGTTTYEFRSFLQTGKTPISFILSVSPSVRP
jgi:hypothetical protein